MQKDAEMVRIGSVWIPKNRIGRSLQLSVPFPPSVNNYWGNRVITGKRSFVQTYLTTKAKDYRLAVQGVVGARWPNLKPSQSRIALHMGFVAPDRRTRDLDNHRKAIYDALTHAGLWEDDSQIDIDVAERYAIEKRGRLILTVMELAPSDSERKLFA
jgi:crossover junction endodeoxyribonuclease RusA